MIDNAPAPVEFGGLIFPLIISMILGVVIHLLAKEKGRNVLLWTIIGFIPGLNIMALWFIVGATNLKLEEKLDIIIEELKIRNNG